MLQSSSNFRKMKGVPFTSRTIIDFSKKIYIKIA